MATGQSIKKVNHLYRQVPIKFCATLGDDLPRPPMPPALGVLNDFTGKFGILLETDKEKDGGLESAKRNVHEKGKDRGFDPVYIFSDADGYKTVAVFDNREKAKEKLSVAKKVNTTAE